MILKKILAYTHCLSLSGCLILRHHIKKLLIALFIIDIVSRMGVYEMKSWLKNLTFGFFINLPPSHNDLVCTSICAQI